VEAEFQLNVNGEEHNIRSDPERSLLDVLREDLRLTGTKYGCGEGQCRACTVLLDGRPASSCLTSVSRAAGKKITTIEGLAAGDKLHPVQRAFLEQQAMQCGYCTPGQILTAVALLQRNATPTDDEIVDGMNGNICRCNGYPSILAAVRRAAELTSAARKEEADRHAG
jgi:aerobic-type carbon monoxide dehydrogenase small subunit (CoxS/CutS family)